LGASKSYNPNPQKKLELITMRNFLFILFFTSFALVANATNAAPFYASMEVSEGNPNLDAINQALNAGDVDALSKYFAENVEISILDKEQSYTKAKAAEALRTFFSSNKPKSFAQVHQGTSRENSDQYSIGNLTASSGNFRVYIYLKVVGNSFTIQELRFDKA
jgi:hypothetical protein